MDRWPACSSRLRIQSGVTACALTPLTTRPEKRPHRSAASIRTGTLSETAGVTDGQFGVVKGADVKAATSRATPAIDKQSARFGVSLISNTRASRFIASRRFLPSAVANDSGKASRPSASSEIPSSFAEQSMPWLSTPRIFARLILKPPGSTAPSVAHGATMPACTFGAPQTICSMSGCPISTVQTRSRSASGCGVTAVTRPITTPENSGARGSASSTSRPAMVSASASASESIGGLTIALSHCSGTRILRCP